VEYASKKEEKEDERWNEMKEVLAERNKTGNELVDVLKALVNKKSQN